MDSAVFATFVVTLAQRKTCQRRPDKGLQNYNFFGPKSDENQLIYGLWADAHQIPSPEPPGSVLGTPRGIPGGPPEGGSLSIFRLWAPPASAK